MFKGYFAQDLCCWLTEKFWRTVAFLQKGQQRGKSTIKIDDNGMNSEGVYNNDDDKVGKR